MKNTKIQKNLKTLDQTSNNTYSGRKPTKINEKSFISNVITNAKEFIKKSVKSITKNAKNIINNIKKEFMSKKSTDLIKPGNMLTYNYNAKDKSVIFDKRPLGICLGWSKQTKGNFYLLNFHHLPMKDRVFIASFFVELNKKRNGSLIYNDIKPFMKKFGNSVVLRQYIYNRVSNRVIHIHDNQQFLTAAAIDTSDWFKP